MRRILRCPGPLAFIAARLCSYRTKTPCPAPSGHNSGHWLEEDGCRYALWVCERALILNDSGGRAFTLSHCRRVSRRRSRSESFAATRCGVLMPDKAARCALTLASTAGRDTVKPEHVLQRQATVYRGREVGAGR
ncbi:hypothetical protein KCP69_18380 [Salmonella enterica subsp. enterica]|nr:hypothetical protein KCP69_18380 [Salmonella enterica subsp. enterica]